MAAHVFVRARLLLLVSLHGCVVRSSWPFALCRGSSARFQRSRAIALSVLQTVLRLRILVEIETDVEEARLKVIAVKRRGGWHRKSSSIGGVYRQPWHLYAAAGRSALGRAAATSAAAAAFCSCRLLSRAANSKQFFRILVL